MTSDVHPPNGGWFALVYYVPEPLSSEIARMRELLPGEELSPAHITFLPPRALIGSADSLCRRVGERLSGFDSFEANLTGIRLFEESNFMYIDIAAGGETISRIHHLLNTGDFSAPELFDFHPHLTLAGPIPPEHLSQALNVAAQVWSATTTSRKMLIDQIVCLWRETNDELTGWLKVGSCPLAREHSKGKFRTTTQT